MSHIVNTGTAALCRGKDRPCGVHVAILGVSAGRAVKRSDTRTRPRTSMDELSWAGPDCGVRRSTGHPPLNFRPFSGAPVTVPEMWQIESRISRGGGGPHTPVDPDRRAIHSSYFVATTVGATLEIVERYVENQRHA